MKVYSKLVIDIETGEVLEEESFEYSGPVARAGGGDVKVPGPTPEQKAAQREQTEMNQFMRQRFEESARREDLLAPLLYEQIGVTPQYDEAGQIIGFTKEEDPLAAQREEIEAGFLERTLAAQRGELPIDPALRSRVEGEELTLREMLAKQIGPGYELSTPGSERLSDFFRSREELFSGASRGELALSEQFGLAREMAGQQGVTETLNRIFGVEGFRAGSIGRAGQVASSFQMPLSNFLQQQQMGLQAGIAKSQFEGQRLRMFGDIAGGGMMGLGAFLGG